MSATATATLPATGTWAFDQAHTSIEAVARHLMVTKVRVAFKEYEGTFEIAEPVIDSRIDVTIKTGSLESGEAQRDGHLKSEDFLAVETYPTMHFASKQITHEGGADYKVAGDLTIKDVTKPVTLDVTYHGVANDPWGNAHAAFEVTGEIDREEWGITWNQALETGGVLVSKTVKLEFDVQLLQPQDD